MSEPADILKSYLGPGDRVAEQYVVEETFDSGSFSAIYMATDLRDGEPRAVKALPPLGEGPADETAVGRFEREMRVIENIDHESLVELYDYGRTDDGVAFMVLEYIEGRTLEALVDEQEGGIPLDGALAIARQIATGLDVAHDEGVIHRDLKPANVMVVSRTAGYRAKLLDFGMAKLFRTLGDRTIADLTREGAAVGTPRYIAPEQAKGSDQVGPRTDLYALGLILYEMATGQKAVRADTIEDALRAHLHKDPLDLPKLAELPEPVAELVEHLTRKHHDERIDSASHVLAELDVMTETPLTLEEESGDEELFGPPVRFDNPTGVADVSVPNESELRLESNIGMETVSSRAPSGEVKGKGTSHTSEQRDSSAGATGEDSATDASQSVPDLPDDAVPSTRREEPSTESEDRSADSPPSDDGNTSPPTPPMEDDESLEVDWESYERSEPTTHSPDVAHTKSSHRTRTNRRRGEKTIFGLVALPFLASIAFVLLTAQCAEWHPVWRATMGCSPLLAGLVVSQLSGRRTDRFIHVAVGTSVLGIVAAHLIGVGELARRLWSEPVWFMAPVEHLPVFDALAEGVRWIARQYATLLDTLFDLQAGAEP